MVKDKNRVKKQQISFTTGSGNVFADLGLENAEELLIKADLSLEIYKRVKKLGLSQARQERGSASVSLQVAHFHHSERNAEPLL